MILLVLPVSTSIFMVHFFSAESIQRIPIGIIHYDYSKLSERLEYSLSANPVLELKYSVLILVNANAASGVVRYRRLL